MTDVEDTIPPESGSLLAASRAPTDPVRWEVPRILHIIWVGPHNPPQELIDTWDKKHVNNWLIMPWKDHKQGFFNQAQIDQRYARREFNGVADVMRWEILFKYGGFAVDADSECMKALDEGPADFFGDARAGKALMAYENESVRPGIVGCGFLGGAKGHPFFERAVELCGQADASKMAWETVGPMLCTNIAQEMLEDIKIYPAKMFNPVHYSGAPAPGIHPIYAQQKWGSTKGYNQLRKRPCWCDICRVNMLHLPWG